MRIANKHVQLWVTDGQHAYMKAKAKGYGITLTRLVLLAVEVYARTYDEVPEGSSLIVVNYGTWCRMDLYLQDVRDNLHDVRLQLAAIRSAARRGQDEGTVRAVDECAREMARTAVNVAHCSEVLDRVIEMPLLADPYAGPLEDASPVEDLPQGDDEEESL